MSSLSCVFLNGNVDIFVIVDFSCILSFQIYDVDEDGEGNPRVCFDVPKLSAQEGGLINNKKENRSIKFVLTQDSHRQHSKRVLV